VGASPGLQSGGAGLQARGKHSHPKPRASALVYALGLIAAAVGLVVVIFAVVDGIEQIEDLHCLRRRMYSSKAAVTASSVVP
jgi:hypothetical protein